MLFFGMFLRESARTAAKSRTNLEAQIREKLSNGWADWHQIWHTCADSSGNGYSPNKLPLETQRGTCGVLGGQKFKIWGSCQMAGPIGTKFDTRLRIRLGMDIG